MAPTRETTSTRTLSVFLLCATALLLWSAPTPVAGQDGIKKFNYLVTVGDYPAGQSGNQNSLILSYDAEFWYSDLWDPSTAPDESQALRFEVSLNTSTGQVHINELEIYQDLFLEFTWCRDTCGFEDLFGTTPMPQLWCPGSGGTQPSSSINGVPASSVRFFSLNDDFVSLWCHADELLPLRAVLHYDNSDKRIDFNTFLTDTFPNSVFEPAPFCPDVDPSCFRLDLVVVVDKSTSVLGPWRIIVDFVRDLADAFVVSPQRVNIGLIGTMAPLNWDAPPQVGYSVLVTLSDNKTALTEQLIDAYTDYPAGVTPLIKAIAATLPMLQGGRPNTKKAILVVTDGKGNVPCTDAQFCGGSPDLQNAPNCDGDNDCVQGGGSCGENQECWDKHDTWYQHVYPAFDDAFPGMFEAYAIATGPTNELNQDGLDLIVRDQPQNRFSAVNYEDLSKVTYELAKALSCPIPGTTPCPNNCRPGGLCCAGSCECIQDCSLLSTDKCQQGICLVTKDATQCTVVGNKCGSSSGSDDQAGIIAGAVVGGVVLAALLVGLFAAAGVAIFFFQQKTMADVIAMEQAFANQAGVKQNPTFVERGGAGVSRLYEEKK